MKETELPMVSVPSKPEHWKNAPEPMVVTEFGMVKSPVRSKQNEKAPAPMEVTELGMSIDVNPVRPQNAFSPIAETVLGITVFTHPVSSSFVLVVMMALQLSLESKTGFAGSTVIPLNAQYLNELVPIDVTLLGMFSTPCIPLQSSKA